ncbi:hypothetical protein BUALT_Bualt07G0080300 [Buddleja alternifolia]|uniref:peptidyl-tRNA hydrolase n=1 Tax=Buddleja alternifolia TaxID=168488 RepID=A0AAV6XAF4_9LAMI|nr:hypothetical protein BUALT_Bualt07G0080300 [Buddleja alternifolia]
MYGISSAALFPRSSSAAAIGRRHLSSKSLFSISPSSNWWNLGKSSVFGSPSPSPCIFNNKAMASSISTVEEKAKPWLLVGLGNPGKRYTGTRHNVSTPSPPPSLIGDVPVMLAKPQTFMNASGESVGAIVSYYKIPLKQVLVMFDDMDLPFAKLRLLPKGGHGGHNGMRSIINHLKGSKDFPRLRIGIGRPPGKMDPASFVLRPFNREERQELDFTLQNGLEAVRILVHDDFNKSATFVNTAKSLQL